MRRAGFIENPDLVHHHFYFTGGNRGVNRLGGPLLHHAFNGHHKLWPQQFRFLVRLDVAFGAKHRLGYALAVSYMNEHQRAQIAAAMYPTHQQHSLAGIGRAQRSAIMRPAKLA